MEETTAIKVYTEVSFIETYDGEQIALNIPIKVLEQRINDSNKFLDLGNDFLNKSSIKRYYLKKVDSIDNAILNIADRNLRDRVKKQIDERRKNGQRVNEEILSNIIQRYENE